MRDRVPTFLAPAPPPGTTLIPTPPHPPHPAPPHPPPPQANALSYECARVNESGTHLRQNPCNLAGPGDIQKPVAQGGYVRLEYNAEGPITYPSSCGGGRCTPNPCRTPSFYKTESGYFISSALVTPEPGMAPAACGAK